MKTILSAALAMVQAVLAAMDAVLKAIFLLFGVRSGASTARPVPQISTRAKEVEDALENSIMDQKSLDYRLSLKAGAGGIVHQYASVMPELRSTVDLGALSIKQQDWLLMLSDRDLKRLAQAGPDACELAVSGRRSGIVGLPVPVSVPESSPVPDARQAVRNLFVSRLNRNAENPAFSH